jgi:hypothetical protein
VHWRSSLSGLLTPARSPAEARRGGASMPQPIWDLSGTDDRCDSYGPAIRFTGSISTTPCGSRRWSSPSARWWTTTGWCTSKAMTYLWCSGITARSCYVLRCNAPAGWPTGSLLAHPRGPRGSLLWRCAQPVQLGSAGGGESASFTALSTLDQLTPSAPSRTSSPPSLAPSALAGVDAPEPPNFRA